MMMRRLVLYPMLSVLLASPLAAQTYVAELTGDNEVPPVESPFSGFCTAELVAGDLHVECTHDIPSPPKGPDVKGTSTLVTAAHIHNAPAGVDGPVVFAFTDPESPIVETWTDVDSDMVDELNVENLYVNVHSDTNPGGEIRGQLVRQQPPILEIPTVGHLGLAALALLLAGAGFHRLRR